jgi:dipeptidyl aminopeptidase/acylaminoacyl peptidase
VVAPDETGVAHLPRVAELAPSREVLVEAIDGRFQVVAREGAATRVVTSAAGGVDVCEIEPDGAQLWWFEAGDGDVGRWLRQPFDGGATAPALRDVPDGRMYGIAFDRVGSTVAIAVGVDGDTRVYVGAPGGKARLVATASGYLSVVDMAPDGQVLALAGQPDGPHAICLHRPATGEFQSLGGNRDRRLWALEFRPDSTPELLVAVARRASGCTLATWRADTGLVDHDWLRHDAEITACWQDRDTVLMQRDRAGRSTLFAADLNRRTVRVVPTPSGTILDTAPGPEGTLRYLWTRAGVPPRVHVHGQPENPPKRDRHRELRTGRRHGFVHSFLATPSGRGPWPTIFQVHGGPATHDRDCFDPRVELFVDNGFAVARTNYVGSTGYGWRWRHGARQPVGLAQVADLAAVRRHLVQLGVAVPDAVGLAGSSWGAYLALLSAGLRPALWAAVMAVHPVADCLAAHHGTTPALREMDVELFGGTPAEVPDPYRTASPMTYVDRVRAPVLLVASRTDEKCPPEQVERYADALRVPHELVWVGGGHHSRDAGDHAAVIRTTLGFALSTMEFSRPDRLIALG